MNNNRRSRRYRYNRKKSKMNFLAIVVIILVAVIMGIMTAKLVIYVISMPEATGNDAAIIEDQLNITTEGIENQTGSAIGEVVTTQQITQQTSGYCIQFGNFSTREAADSLVAQLKASGITASVTEKDGNYKVTGQLLQTKQQPLRL